MRLRFERDALSRALKTVQPASNDKASLPIMGGVRIVGQPGDQPAELCCTDFDLRISTRVHATCDVADHLVMPVRLLSKIVDKLPDGAVEIACDNPQEGRVIVTSGETTATLWGFDPTAWPVGDVAEGEPVTLDEADLHQLARIEPTASLDTARPIICAIRIGRGYATEAPGEAAASDSYGLAVAELSVDLGDGAWLVPADAVKTVAKATDGPVDLTLGDRHASFTAGATTWTTQLTEGDFPAYKGLIPQPDAITRRWVFDTEALLRALDRTDTVPAGDRTTDGTRIEVEGGKALLSRSEDGLAAVEVTIPVDATGDGVVGVNPDYLRRIARAAEAERVELGIVDHLKPMLIESDRLTQALMPVRLPERLR